MRRRRNRVWAGLGLAAVVGTAAVGWLVLRSAPTALAECAATAATQRFLLDPEQAANATTIAAEAHRLGLPNHAVSVGLAAALQESKLRNLNYGDRDSLGLFQQRPSQGWGAPVQLLQPSYASSAFFRALRKVDGWQALPIYQAAQRVQRSADGAAYAAWDTESRALAQGLTGEAPGTFSCTFPPVRPSTAATRREVISDVSTALGPGAFAPEATLSYRWLVASWLVTRAPKYSLDRVSLSGWTWSPAKGWLADSRSRQRAVSFSLRPGA